MTNHIHLLIERLTAEMSDLIGINSLQVGFGSKGSFVDIDLFNPSEGYVDEHQTEIEINRGPPKRVTPHFYIAKQLGNCR